MADAVGSGGHPRVAQISAGVFPNTPASRLKKSCRGNKKKMPVRKRAFPSTALRKASLKTRSKMPLESWAQKTTTPLISSVSHV